MKTLVLAAALCAAAAAPPARAEAPRTESPSPVKVRLVSAQSGAAPRTVAAAVAAGKHATIATRVAATVSKVFVEEGDQVTQGQVLVELADNDLQAQRSAALAAQSSAVAHEKRITALVAQRAATTAELEQAQTMRAQADAAVKGAEAQLAYTRLRAPFAAVVQARRVSAGDLVGPGAPLYELDGKGFELQASLSEEESRGLKHGAKVAFELDGARGEAEITALVPGGDPVSHRSGLRARVVKAPPGLRTGDFARLVLPSADEAAALWVPKSSLVTRGDLTGVFVSESGIASLRWLSLAETQGDRVRVRAGLQDGEKFVEGPKGVRDGQRLEVLP
jgi:RND family efflux transporter MFP subunit